jgi:3-phenylpropionate/trans-cinnamate dioxygenase ferredoxin reductase subunit
MTNFRNVSIRGRTFRVRAGDVLLDGALANGVDMPHDCRAGTCGTCMVQVVKGQTVCGETHTQGMVHACQARVVSDLEVEMEDVPEIDTTRARLTGIRELAPDIVELMIAPEREISYLPGQYFRFTFNGFPARAFSPTASFDGRIGGAVIRLNVKRVRGGRVSSALGTTIRPGHRLRVQGPFGRAFLRPGGKGRLILAGSGTGFAPIWAIACMALRENRERDRPIVVIAGARRLSALYMKPVLAQLARLPNVAVIPTIEEGPSPHPSVRLGRIEAHLPRLDPSDIIYACGSPRMVNALAAFADSAGATFYADPFESSAPEEKPAGLLGILKTLVQARPDLEQASEERAPRQAEPHRGETAGRRDNSRHRVTQFAPTMREHAVSAGAESAMSSANG